MRAPFARARPELEAPSWSDLDGPDWADLGLDVDGPSDDLVSADVGLFRPVLLALSVVALVSLVVLTHPIQVSEAALSAAVAEAVGLPDVQRIGTAVLFTVDGRLTGYQVTLGCTVSLLMLPFAGACTVLLAVRRVPVLRAVAAATSAAVVIVTANQLRLVTVALGMEEWGPADGYARTHVLVGTTISTLGLVLAGSAFLGVLLHGTYPPLTGAGRRPVR